MMGAAKNDPMLEEMLVIMKTRERKGHFSQETEFLGETEKWCVQQIQEQKMRCIDGNAVGIKTKCGIPILLEELMSENYLDVDNRLLFGISIPSEELLRRPKYSWFAILPHEDILNSNVILTKYFQASIVDDEILEAGRKEKIRDLIAI